MPDCKLQKELIQQNSEHRPQTECRTHRSATGPRARTTTSRDMLSAVRDTGYRHASRAAHQHPPAIMAVFAADRLVRLALPCSPTMDNSAHTGVQPATYRFVGGAGIPRAAFQASKPYLCCGNTYWIGSTNLHSQPLRHRLCCCALVSLP